MPSMYGNILLFLVAIVIQALAPRETQAGWSWATVGHILVFPAMAWAALRWRFRGLMSRALHDEAATHALRARFSQLVAVYQGMMLVPYAALCYASPYLGLVVAPVAAGSEAVAAVLGVAPFLLLLGVVWWEAYPLQGVLLGRSQSRPAFVASHARMELPVLAPWVVLMGLSDLLRVLWPSGYAAMERSALLQLLYAPVFLVLVGVFLPVFIQAAWGCRPLPRGALRDRLEALGGRLGLRLREILYWPLLEGRVMTAGIVGLVPRFRYLLLTPALVETLTDDELDGVVAHEAGHVRYRHLWYYLLFFVGYVCLVALFFRLVEAGVAWWGIADPEALRRPRSDLVVSLATTVGLLVLLVVYFRLVFGALSRAFERQADAHALEAIGRPEPLVAALERISWHSGDIRDLPSWHHGSIAERTAFLWAAARDPSLLDALRRRVRRLVLGMGAAVFGAAVLAVAVHAGPLDRALDRFVAVRGLEHRVRAAPDDPSGWFLLGNLYYDAGDEVGAERSYRKAIELDPENPEALNNLAWLYVTARTPALDRPERALALAELAVRLRRAPHLLDTLAEARYRVHDLDGAVAATQEALRMNPRNRGYYEAQLRRFLDARKTR